MADRPFPVLAQASRTAPSENPNGFRVFELPRQQREFDEFVYERGLLRDGTRRWKNIDGRSLVRLEFMLDVPPHLRGRPLHAKVNSASGNERSIDLWPASERRVRVHVAAGSECVLPETWSSAILTVHDGIIVGGMAPASMRPLGVAPTELADGLSHLQPDPEAA